MTDDDTDQSTAMDGRNSTSALGSPLLHLLLAFSIFLTPGVAFIHGDGYSFGPALLLIGAILYAVRYRHQGNFWSDLPGMVKLIVLAMVAYAVVWMTDGLLRGEGIRDMDRPSRFLLAAFSLMVIARARIHAAWLWAGLAAGGMSTGALAIQQKLIEGVDRATGYTQTVQYGNLSMAVGLTCLAGLIWAMARPSKRQKTLWIAIMLAGALGGVMAGFLSGTRGSWLELLVVPLVGLWAAVQLRQTMKYLVATPLVIGLLLAGLYSFPETGVKERFDTAVEEIEGYFVDGEKSGSAPTRIEMWKGAWIIFTESPLVGHGEAAALERLKALGDEGRIDKRASRYTQMHNDWFDVLAERGLLGFLILAGVYLLPIAWFFRFTGRRPRSSKAVNSRPFLEHLGLGTAGIIFPICVFTAGISQVNFTHNSGAMMYSFIVAVLVGMSTQRYTTLRGLSCPETHDHDAPGTKNN